MGIFYDEPPVVNVNINTSEIASSLDRVAASNRYQADLDRHNQEQKLEFENKKWEEEKQLKDRVDISKNEYMQLLQDKKDLEHLRKVFHDKVFMPLRNIQIPENVMEKMIEENEFKTKAQIIEDPYFCQKKVVVVYEVPDNYFKL